MFSAQWETLLNVYLEDQKKKKIFEPVPIIRVVSALSGLDQ